MTTKTCNVVLCCLFYFDYMYILFIYRIKIVRSYFKIVLLSSRIEEFNKVCLRNKP